jgi:hypothetical protein
MRRERSCIEVQGQLDVLFRIVSLLLDLVLCACHLDENSACVEEGRSGVTAGGCRGICTVDKYVETPLKNKSSTVI